MIHITDRVAIPDEEITYTASRSGGPGGQNVNKVSSRVTLWFDVAASPSLDDESRQTIMAKLAPRIGQDGVLRVTSQASRSQVANRQIALARFVELLRDALRPRPKRVKTRVSLTEKRKRLEAKRRLSEKKRSRSGRLGAES